MIVRYLLLVLIFCVACKSGEIPCPVAKPLKLRKTGHYAINPVKKSQPMASAKKVEVKRISQSGNVRALEVKDLASIEEWDCPKPGMNKPPKFVQQNIKMNKKKMNAYFKNKTHPDSSHVAFGN